MTVRLIGNEESFEVRYTSANEPTGNSEFSNCVRERSLKVLELCDLSKC